VFEWIQPEVSLQYFLVVLVVYAVFVVVRGFLGIKVGEHRLAGTTEKSEVVQQPLQVGLLEVVGSARLDGVPQVLECCLVIACDVIFVLAHEFLVLVALEFFVAFLLFLFIVWVVGVLCFLRFFV
jgi:hypothetical protein